MGELETKLGGLLQLERERRGASLADLSTELKISEESLVSIEKGDAGTLPSELYYKLFSKTYAEHLGIDYGKTLDAIREEIGESLEPETKPGDARKNGESSKPGKTARSERAATEEEEEEPTEEKTFIKKVIYISVAIVVVFCLVLIGYEFILDNGDEPTNADLTAEGTEQPTGTANAEGLKAEYAEYRWGVPENAEPDSLLVTLMAREQSWATVLADGDTILYQNLTPGREYQVKAAYRVLIGIGIPRLVEIKLDGEPVDLVDPTSGRISRVEINQSNKMTFEAPRPRNTRTRPSPPPTTSAAVDTTALSVDTVTAKDDSL